MKLINLFTTILLFTILTISIKAQMQPGDLDTTFSGDGKTIFSLPGIDNALDVAIDSNGVIYAAGYNSNTHTQMLIVSFKPDGSLNGNFGNGGYVIEPILDSSTAYAIDIQDDGKIVVGGRASNSNANDMFVSRFNTDGSFDNSFGNGGTRILSLTPSSDIVKDIKIQPNGSILATGVSYINGVSRMVLVRYLSDGSYDYSFGNAGIVIKRIDRFSNDSNAIALTSTGKIYQVGRVGQTGKARFAILRYNNNGSMDIGFGNNGVVTTNISNNSDAAYSIAIQKDQKIVVAGMSDFIYPGYYSSFAMVRYLPNGSIDKSFSINGYALINNGSQKSRLNGMAIQKDGKIVASGYTYINQSYKYVVVRVKEDGWLDQTWGYNGFSYADLGLGYSNKSYGMALDSSGKPVLGGYGLGVARFFNVSPPL